MASREPAGAAAAGAREHAPAGELRDRHSFLLMRRIGTLMFLLGAGTLLATLPLPDPDSSDHRAIEVVALLLALGAAAVWASRTYRPWLTRGSAVYGTLLVSALMGVTRPIEATPFFYLWPMLFAAYFFSRREVAANLLVMWISMGIALFGWSNDPMKGVMFMGVGISVTLAAVVVTLLREHLTALIGQLEKASNTDYLTQLPNRRAFDAELRMQLARALRSGVTLSLVIFDLDHYKENNDRHGHDAGDRALCEFAALLEHERRQGDTLARVGGEEFAVVLFGADSDSASAFAERVGRRTRALAVQGVPLSTSAGVATIADTHGDPAQLLLAADRALYAAKNAGRHRVATWWEGREIRVGDPIDDVAHMAAA
jgi:diguanylate cyclase (GGDEF)-like protein